MTCMQPSALDTSCAMLAGGQSFNPANLSESIALTNLTSYNMYLDTITELKPMPEPRYRFGCAVLDDKLYVFGGFTGIEETGGVKSNSTLIYTFATNEWAGPEGTPQMNYPRADIWGSAVDGKVSYILRCTYETCMSAGELTSGGCIRVCPLQGGL